LGKRLERHLEKTKRILDHLTVEYGILLAFIGITMTIIGLYIAYTIGAQELKKKEKKKLTNPVAEYWQRLK